MASTMNDFQLTDFYSNLFSDKLSSNSHPNQNEDRMLVKQLTDQSQPSPFLIYGKISSDGPIVVWFGHQPSTLRTEMIRYLVSQDITLILFSIEEYLWKWLNSNPSLTVVSFILQPSMNSHELIAHSHSYVSIRSILIRCSTPELINLERFTRVYPKVDGIYDDDQRLLSKLMIDLIFHSDELGDQFRENEKNEIAAQRNYSRALKFCALVKTI